MYAQLPDEVNKFPVFSGTIQSRASEKCRCERSEAISCTGKVEIVSSLHSSQ
jgi:hypothetical protein